MFEQFAERARLARRLCRVYPPEAVTTRSAREVPAREAGLSQGSVEAIWDAVVATYQAGLHPALALCLRRGGHIVLDRAIGHERGNAPQDPAHAPRDPATPETLFSLFSASKAVTSMLVHALDQARLLHLEDRVVDYIPEFGRHGKDKITLRHVLTHTAGIPTIPSKDISLDLLTRTERILPLLCEARPTSRAGRRLAYHAVTGGYILQAVMERVTGKGLREILDEYIRKPLKMKDFTYGVSPGEVHRVAPHVVTGPSAEGPHGWLLKRSLGISHEEAVSVSNEPGFLTGIIPSGNIFGTAEETGRFFECLLHGGAYDGVQVFEPRTVQRAVAEQSWMQFDSMLMAPVRYGMGFMLGGRPTLPFGPDTERAFGHIGFTNVVCWADPARDVSVAFMNTGKPFLSLRLLRWVGVMRAVSNQMPTIQQTHP